MARTFYVFKFFSTYQLALESFARSGSVIFRRLSFPSIALCFYCWGVNSRATKALPVQENLFFFL